MSGAATAPAKSNARDGLTNATRVMTEDQLTQRHRLMIEYMVHGLHHPTLLSRLPLRYMPAGVDEEGAPILKMGRPEVFEALSLEDAAAACNVRPRIARLLSKQPVFTRLLSSEIAAFRDGSKARAMRRVVSLVDEPGLGKAADRKVQLAAAQLVLGEGNSNGPTVNVNVGLQMRAGIVIDLTDDRPDTRTIEHAV